MKTRYSLMALAGVLAFSGVAWAQMETDGGPKLVVGWAEQEWMQQGQTDPRPNADLVAIGTKLQMALAGTFPEAKVAIRGDGLGAWYSSAKYGTHLRDLDSNISKATADKFPTDFQEFSLLLSVDRDYLFERPDNVAQSEATHFGTTFRARFDLKRLESSEEREFEDVPLGHWAYVAYGRLAGAGLVKDFAAQGFHQRAITRYEMAVEVARSVYQQDVAPQQLTPNLAKALLDLRKELAPEIYKLELRLFAEPTPEIIKEDRTQKPPYEYLSLEFSYGKGMDPALVEKIKRVIADYAAEKLKADATKGAVAVPK